MHQKIKWRRKNIIYHQYNFLVNKDFHRTELTYKFMNTIFYKWKYGQKLIKFTKATLAREDQKFFLSTGFLKDYMNINQVCVEYNIKKNLGYYSNYKELEM